VIAGIFWIVSFVMFALGLTGTAHRGILSIFAGFMWLGTTLAITGSSGDATLACNFCSSPTITLTPTEIFWLGMVSVILIIVGFARYRGKL
jgi:hypothetical protein